MLALGALRDRQSARFLGDILRDPQADSTMRGAAAMALGIGCGDKATKQLLAYHCLEARDKDPLTSRLVVLATGFLREEKNAELLRAFLAAADEPGRPKAEVKKRTNINNKVIVTSDLRGLLASRDDTLRGTTALVLAKLNDRAAASAIMRVMNDPFAPGFTRCNAAVALGNLGKRKEGGTYLRQVLVDMLNGSKKNSYGTLAYAAIGLSQFPGEDTLKVLYAVAGKKTTPRVVALNAFIALGHLKDPRLVPFQIRQYRLLGGVVNAYHRGEILRALISHPPQQSIRRLFIDALRRDRSEYVRQRAAIGLARYPGSDTVFALGSQLGDRDWETRGQAALSLGVLKAKAAIGKLRNLMKNDRSDWVRLCARKALENIIKYGDHPTWQTTGLQKMIDERLFRVGASLPDEMNRMYSFAYNHVLELGKPYTANTKVD
jgi:HEAT repeat protein